jgi:hypothetical protein
MVETIKYFDSDFLKITFTIQDDYVSNISLEIKDKSSFKPITSANKVLVNNWFQQFHNQIQRMLLSAPADVIVQGSSDLTPDMSPQYDLAGNIRYMCPRCKVDLVKRESCCGGKADMAECPSCKGRFRVPKNKDSNANVSDERLVGGNRML